MSYRIGIVKETEPSGYAQVVTERKTVCGECYHNKIVCYGCLLSPRVVGRVANPIGARVGDMVKIHISAGKYANSDIKNKYMVEERYVCDDLIKTLLHIILISFNLFFNLNTIFIFLMRLTIL